MDAIKELWLEYYPVITTGLVAVSVAAGTIYALWSQVKPILDGIKSLKEKLTSKDEQENLKDKLAVINIDNQICDLREKINNPLISDESRATYTRNLEQLIAMKTKLENNLAVVTETVNKYSG